MPELRQEVIDVEGLVGDQKNPLSHVIVEVIEANCRAARIASVEGSRVS